MLVADRDPDGIQRPVMLRGGLDIREQGHVIAGVDLRQQRLDRGIQGRALLPGPADPLPHGWWVALGENFPGEVFCLLDVGLVEDIDPQDRARHRDRILPAKEFGAKTEWVRELQRDHRVPRLAQGLEACRVAVVLLGEGEPDKQPVVAVDLGRSQRFVGHRHQPLALFAGALRDQLLGPDPEALHRGRRNDRDLVAANFRRLGQDRSQPGARVLADRHRRRAGLHHRGRPVQESGEINATQGSRHQPEVRKGRVSPTDVSGVEKDSPESLLCGFVLKRRPRVGDRDELPAVAPGALEEVSIVR